MDNGVVVLLIILGAGLIMLMFWAIAHRFAKSGLREDTENAGKEFDQIQYMRELRLRNVDRIGVMYGYKYPRAHARNDSGSSP